MDNLDKKLEDLEKQVQITEEKLQSIYVYLSMYMENMPNEELEMWKSLLQKYDPEFNDQEDE